MDEEEVTHIVYWSNFVNCSKSKLTRGYTYICYKKRIRKINVVDLKTEGGGLFDVEKCSFDKCQLTKAAVCMRLICK